MWRLVMSNCGITYQDVIEMDDDEIYEANAALDIHIKMINDNLEDKDKNHR